MVTDPDSALFWVSWQAPGEGAIEDTDLPGAEEAITWGLARSPRVFIRLGHHFGSYFWAGEGPVPADWDREDEPIGVWPPSGEGG
jgi:hypothetical protein